MKKIPTLFQRNPDDRRRVLPLVTPGCEWVLSGEGVATRKYDGTCVLIRRDGIAVIGFARREVKPDKQPPPNFIETGTDEATGKTMGWEPIAQSGFAKWFDEAVTNHNGDTDGSLTPGTYELCGPKINGNPEGYEHHRLIPHDRAEVFPVLPTLLHFDGLRLHLQALGEAGFEGLVWHHPDGRMAKLKARDFPPTSSENT